MYPLFCYSTIHPLDDHVPPLLISLAQILVTDLQRSSLPVPYRLSHPTFPDHDVCTANSGVPRRNPTPYPYSEGNGLPAAVANGLSLILGV